MIMNDEVKQEYYTVEELSVKLNIAVKTIRNHTQAGNIPGQVKVFGLWRYRVKDIEEALEKGTLCDVEIKEIPQKKRRRRCH